MTKPNEKRGRGKRATKEKRDKKQVESFLDASYKGAGNFEWALFGFSRRGPWLCSKGLSGRVGNMKKKLLGGSCLM